MAKKFVNLDNLEHVIEKHDRDVQGLNDALQRIDAKVDKVIFGEVGEDAAIFSLRRDAGTDLDSIYSPEKDGEAEAGVYLDDSGDVPTYRFAFKIPQGKQGVQGEQGPQGEQGEQGPRGEMGEPYYNRYVMAFCHCDHDDYDKPTISDIAGTWVPSEDNVTIYDPHDKFIWFLSDETLEPPIWMAHGRVVKDFKDDPKNPIPIKWNSVMQITGDKGETGKDGAAIEFIYKRTKTSLAIPSIPDNDPNIDDFTPDGWSDHPEGVDETMQCEWMCSRLYKESGRWGAWNETTDADGNFIPGNPVIFAKWGERGIDGDGVQYIYKVNNGELLNNPTPTDYETNTEYQEKYGEYVPDGWSDDPSGTSESNLYEWVCVRKYKGVDQKWGPFEGPKLWANWSRDGEDGIPGVRYEARYYKVVGSSQFPAAAKPSDKMNINLPSGWQSSFPSYTADNDTVWVVYTYINYKGEMATIEDGLDADVCGWSEPALLSAINGKDAIAPNYKTYAYKQSDTKPSKPTSNDPKNPGNGWEDIPTSDGQWWMCIGSVNGVTELVTEWSEVMQVNGKDGLPGEAGTGIIDTKIEYGLSSSDNTQPTNWSTTIAMLEPGTYLWTRTIWTYTDGSTETGYQKTYISKDGLDGEDGKPGKDGVGIAGTKIEYGLSSSDSIQPTNWNETIPLLANGNYLWTRTTWTYTDGSTETGYQKTYVGKDGIAQDGKYIEMRFGVGLSAPSVSKSDRNPGSGWSIQPITPNENQHLWMIMATINPDDTLDSEWSTPVRISGERGPQGDTGPTGPQGPGGADGSDGLPGVSFESQYCLGTETAADSSWQDTVPTITVEKPYIWMRQGKRVYSSASDKTGTVNWGAAFRLSGLNGVGKDGESRKGQIIYPAGIYNPNTTYETTDRTAPYVLDPNDGEFYVLDYVGTWLGTDKKRTPCQDYKDNEGKYWQKFESFEAVYAKVGIIANGLIGSAVFNNEYMFSQQGIVPSTGAMSSDYQNFNATNPYDSNNSWWPNFCVDFKTGTVWTSAGKCHFKVDGSGWLANKNIRWNSDGSGSLAKENINWDSAGNMSINGAIRHKWVELVGDNSNTNFGKTYKIEDNSLILVGQEYIPKSNNYIVNTSKSNGSSFLIMPESTNWDGTELTILNSGNGDLYMGNVVVTTDVHQNSIGEITSPITGNTLSSQTRYKINPGTMIKYIGTNSHKYYYDDKNIDNKKQLVSWFQTGSGVATSTSRPFSIQVWSDTKDTNSVEWYCSIYNDSSVHRDMYIGSDSLALKPTNKTETSQGTYVTGFDLSGPTAWLENYWSDFDNNILEFAFNSNSSYVPTNLKICIAGDYDKAVELPDEYKKYTEVKDNGIYPSDLTWRVWSIPFSIILSYVQAMSANDFRQKCITHWDPEYVPSGESSPGGWVLNGTSGTAYMCIIMSMEPKPNV